jgi:hypothetical protein
MGYKRTDTIALSDIIGDEMYIRDESLPILSLQGIVSVTLLKHRTDTY